MHHWGLHPTQPVTSQARDPRKPSPTLREDLPNTRTRALQGSQCKQPLAALLTYHREPLLIMIDGSPDRALRLGGVPHAYVFAPARARSPIQYSNRPTYLHIRFRIRPNFARPEKWLRATTSTTLRRLGSRARSQGRARRRARGTEREWHWVPGGVPSAMRCDASAVPLLRIRGWCAKHVHLSVRAYTPMCSFFCFR